MYWLQISDQNALERLSGFLRTVHVEVLERRERELRVGLLGALTPSHEQRELEGYVATWNALNPNVELTLLPSPPG